MTDSNFVADAAEETFRVIRALNTRINRFRLTIEKQCLASLVDAAKAHWWETVASFINERKRILTVEHRRSMEDRTFPK